MSKRGKVWLAAAGLVISEQGEWLVVKKKYGGLKGMWSIPAGFVHEGETADAAAVREVFEETGIACKVKGMIGLRTGVIKEEISDNMLIFLLEPIAEKNITIQEEEIEEATFIKSDYIVNQAESSIMLKHLLNRSEEIMQQAIENINPGNQFSYTAYKLFL
ncbi:NUDIX domain-containing protein [Cytobacillus gottheilii]|uniref:NUDIX hydrolase n=1 Tax=Cytobacillus gottheilii TaxID=859144 RepID=A0ABX8FCN3_9BACI|nr:NUDIX hydrolase [Cytobacillus gottheilii]QVY60897.1 NUDIX hydrolase [Cytobacillus gottheilii]